MRDSRALEALEGLLDAMAAGDSGERPAWVTAYRQLLVEEVVDGYHMGFTVGLARVGDRSQSEQWIQALPETDDPYQSGHRWALEAIWAIANHQALPDHGLTLGEPLDHDGQPMLRRIHGTVQAVVADERGDLMDALRILRGVYLALDPDDATHRVACGLEVVTHLLLLVRLGEAERLLEELYPAVQALETPELIAEFHHLSADLATHREDREAAREHHTQAAVWARDDAFAHRRVDPVILNAHEAMHRGRLQEARLLLEETDDLDEGPLAPLRRQRRLGVCGRLYNTIEDRLALFGLLQAHVKLAMDTGWTSTGNLGSLIDDLVVLACQFGEEEVADQAIRLGRSRTPDAETGSGAIGDSETEAWLDLATVRIEAWRENEEACAAALNQAIERELVAFDLAYCQTLVAFVDTYGNDAHKAALVHWPDTLHGSQLGPSGDGSDTHAHSGALEHCIAQLRTWKQHQLASAGLRFKAIRDAEAGHADAAREAFTEAVAVFATDDAEGGDLFEEQVVQAAMEWASWEIGTGNLQRLEGPIGLVIDHSEDPDTSNLLARLSFEQAMFFMGNPEMGEPEEEPAAIVGRWIARAADQYIEGGSIEEANSAYLHLVDWLDARGEHETATSIMSMLNEGAIATGDPAMIWGAARAMASRMHRHGATADAVELLEEAIAQFEDGDPAARGSQHFEVGAALNAVGRGADALEHHRVAVTGLQDASVSHQARARIGLGLAHWQGSGETEALDLAVEAWREALELAYRTGSRELITELALVIDDRLLERYDQVGEVRMTFLEHLVTTGHDRRWELIAHGSDLPLRWAEELAREGRGEAQVEETIRTLLDLAEAVTGMGLGQDGTALMQRAAGIQMLRGHHDAGLALMQEILERPDATDGMLTRANEGLIQAALLTAGGLVHEAWDRLSVVREWLATSCDEEEDEASVDELTLTCQLQCAKLHLLGDKPDAVVTPLTELIATYDGDSQNYQAVVIQSARVTLASALTSLGRSEEAAAQLMAVEAHLEESTTGWFDAIIMAGRLGQRALGEALLLSATAIFEHTHYMNCNAIIIALEACRNWLGFTHGQGVDLEAAEAMAQRALEAHDFELATVLHLLLACYMTDARDDEEARVQVQRAIEIARTHWTMDEMGLMWGVLLPPDLKRFTAALLEADRLQHVN